MLSPEIQRWLDLLPIVADREWCIRKGYIRDQDGACPVCALINELDTQTSWCIAANTAAKAFFGESNGVQEIMDASDLSNNPLRPHLLAALGLK